MPKRHFCAPALAAFIPLVIAASAFGGSLEPQELNVLFGAGKSQPNWRGTFAFASVHVEVISKSSPLESRLGPNTEIVTAMTWSAILQPRTWIGESMFHERDDHAKAGSLFVAARRNFRMTSTAGFFIELGTGPMWSSRRVPAATSRLNFDSQLGFGAVLRTSRAPLYVVYRFSHISNGGLQPVNPGMEVHSIAVGTRAMRLR